MAVHPNDPWAQRPRFRQLVDQWLESNPGMKRVDLALAFEISVESLKQFYSGKIKTPGRNLITRMASVLGCSITDLMDDPGAEIPGASPESSEVDRFMLRVMGSDLTKLTEKQKQNAFEAWRAIVRGYEPPS